MHVIVVSEGCSRISEQSFIIWSGRVGQQKEFCVSQGPEAVQVEGFGLQ